MFTGRRGPAVPDSGSVEFLSAQARHYKLDSNVRWLHQPVLVKPASEDYKNAMKTTLNTDGKIGIPDEIRRTDHLAAGDLFELQRLTPGHYLLTKQPASASRFTIATAEDGLPIIRGENGLITSRLVKEIESETP